MDKASKQTERERNARALKDWGLSLALIGGGLGCLYNLVVGYMWFVVRCHYHEVCYPDHHNLPYIVTAIAAGSVVYFAFRAYKRNSKRFGTVVMLAGCLGLAAWFPYYSWGYFFAP